jgi:hypothetical protein
MNTFSLFRAYNIYSPCCPLDQVGQRVTISHSKSQNQVMLYHQIRDFVPDHKSFPSAATAWLSTALLVLSLCIGLVAVKLPTPSTPGIFMGLLYAFALLIIVSLMFDLNKKRKRSGPHSDWNSNLMSTVAISVLTLCVLPVFYRTTWHQQLNDRSVSLEEDSVVSHLIFPIFEFLTFPP